MLQTIILFGRTIDLYNFFNRFALLAQFIVLIFLHKEIAGVGTLPKLANLYLNKKKRDNLFWQWFFAVLVVLIFGLVGNVVNSLLLGPLSTLFLGSPDANYFTNIFFVPITIFLLSLVMRNAPLKTTDIIAPISAMGLICYKIACFCKGCCNGVAWEHGLMNQDTGRKEFPVQLVEIACAVIMFTILMVLIRKKKHKAGMLYPLFMLMYCGSRFISEFWRDDYPNVWGLLKGYHIQCIIGFVEGAIFLFVVLKWGDRITAYFEEKNQALLDRHAKKIKEKRRQARTNKAPQKKKR